jgi:hypothetical protein
MLALRVGMAPGDQRRIVEWGKYAIERFGLDNQRPW